MNTVRLLILSGLSLTACTKDESKNESSPAAASTPPVAKEWQGLRRVDALTPELAEKVQSNDIWRIYDETISRDVLCVRETSGAFVVIPGSDTYDPRSQHGRQFKRLRVDASKFAGIPDEIISRPSEAPPVPGKKE